MSTCASIARSEVVEPTRELIGQTIEAMDAEDRDDFAAMAAGDLLDRMDVLVQRSRMPWCGLTADGPICVGGVVQINPIVGVPWMFTNVLVARHRIFYARASRRVTERMKDKYSLLFGFEPEGHTKELRWLAWLGFSLHEPLLMRVGQRSMMMRPFSWRLGWAKPQRMLPRE